MQINKAVYTATDVACEWAEAVMKKAYPSIWVGAVTQELVNCDLEKELRIFIFTINTLSFVPFVP